MSLPYSKRKPTKTQSNMLTLDICEAGANNQLHAGTIQNYIHIGIIQFARDDREWHKNGVKHERDSSRLRFKRGSR